MFYFCERQVKKLTAMSWGPCQDKALGHMDVIESGPEQIAANKQQPSLGQSMNYMDAMLDLPCNNN